MENKSHLFDRNLESEIMRDVDTVGRELLKQAVKNRVSLIKINEHPNKIKLLLRTDKQISTVANISDTAGKKLAKFFRTAADLPPATEEKPVEGLAEFHFKDTDVPAKISSRRTPSGIRMKVRLMHPKNARVAMINPNSDGSIIDWMKGIISEDDRPIPQPHEKGLVTAA